MEAVLGSDRVDRLSLNDPPDSDDSVEDVDTELGERFNDEDFVEPP